MRIRGLVAIAVIALVLAIGYAAYWFAAAASIREGVADWAEARRAEGYTVEIGALAVGGFPLRLVATIRQPVIARDAAGWRWSADWLVAEARPWAVERIDVTLPAAQRIVYRRGGDERAVDVTVTRGAAHLRLAGGAFESVTVDAEGIAAETPRGPMALARLEALIKGGRGRPVAVLLDARGLTLAPGGGAPLGREVTALGATATLTGALPGAPTRAALAAWSEAGGTIEVESLTLVWGALEIDASGTLALDDGLRPQAAFNAAIIGYGPVLDAFAAAGAMGEGDASLAKTFLNLMANTESGRRVLEVPITAQDGKLFVGPIPLIELEPVLRF